MAFFEECKGGEEERKLERLTPMFNYEEADKCVSK